MRFKDKSVVVTGASSGIGREIAKEFAQEGAVVVAVARRANLLEELKEECKDFEGRIVPFPGDLTDGDSAKAMLQKAIDETGKLDVLVNNAGIMDDFIPLGELERDFYDRVMELNLNAPVFAMKEAINIMRKQGSGNIVNVNSLAGVAGAKAGAAYTASKHALLGISKNSAHMYKKDGIRINSVIPGGIETGVVGDYSKINQFGLGRVMAAIEADNPMGQPVDIAKACLFLASDDAKFINGAGLVVDGGVLAAE